MTLEPGDVIATGTPAGVGAFRKPPRWLQPGDRVKLDNIPEILDIDVMSESLRDLGVEVDRPGAGKVELEAGHVEWLFVPLEAAAKMRARVAMGLRFICSPPDVPIYVIPGKPRSGGASAPQRVRIGPGSRCARPE